LASSGDNNYIRKMNGEEYGKYINKRVSSWKKTVASRSPKYQKSINKTHSINMTNYWKNISDEKRAELSTKNSITLLAYYKSKRGDVEFQKKLKERARKAQETIENNPEIRQRQKEAKSGENNWAYGKNIYNHLNEKYGKERADEYRKKIKNRFTGEKNGMYKKGYKISGSKNGRAINVIIHMPSGEKYLCIGTFKKFSKEILSKFKPQPHRKYGYNMSEDINGWFIKKISNINDVNKNNYILYE